MTRVDVWGDAGRRISIKIPVADDTCGTHRKMTSFLRICPAITALRSINGKFLFEYVSYLSFSICCGRIAGEGKKCTTQFIESCSRSDKIIFIIFLRATNILLPRFRKWQPSVHERSLLEIFSSLFTIYINMVCTPPSFLSFFYYVTMKRKKNNKTAE